MALVDAVATLADAVAQAPRSAPQPSRPPKRPLEELVVGATLNATVRTVESYGAFLDIGYTSNGILHIAEMNEGFIKDARDLFKQGDTLEVRVKAVHLDRQQIEFTRREESSGDEPAAARSTRRRRLPDLSAYATADPTAYVQGNVSAVTNFGAFVTLKEGIDGLVHISEIPPEMRAGELPSIGQEVRVRVIDYDPAKRQVSLSLKPFPGAEEAPREGGDRPSDRQARRERADGRERSGRERRDYRSRRGPAYPPDDLTNDPSLRMTDAELEALTLDYEDPDAASGFRLAFERAGITLRNNKIHH